MSLFPQKFACPLCFYYGTGKLQITALNRLQAGQRRNRVTFCTQQKIFVFQCGRPAWKPTHPPIQWALGVNFAGELVTGV